jgi:cytochrome c5
MALPVAAAALVCAAAAPLGAGAPTDARAGAPIVQEEARTGEQIVNASCTGACHDMWPIQTAAKDEAAWAQSIENMLAQGASLTDEEWAPLMEYLVRYHGPMPDGEGKDIVLNTCTICHDLTRIKRSRHTPEEWQGILIAMLNEGAPLPDQDFPTVLLYLARNFGL